MSTKAGALLWHRRRLTLSAGLTTVDTGLTQLNKSFANDSIGEPPLGVAIAPPGPPDGTTPASRVHVIPMSPIPAWTSVTHGEPFVDPATGTVKVTFNNTVSPAGPVTINVLFWDPHTIVGPGQADTYHPGQ
jgi:hypothetical protein